VFLFKRQLSIGAVLLSAETLQQLVLFWNLDFEKV